jgi:UDP-N-acetyl-2-amino-2-deoxyglucuronate dehydrogenase
MLSKLRVGIIGSGGIAQAHAAGLQALGDLAELAACCDVVPGRAARFAETWGIPRAYDSARALLDAGGVDLVAVCTPHPQHAEPTVLAAERGVHALVEKPLSVTLADADRMLEASAKHGTVLSTVAQRRWFPAAQRVRRALDAGELGKPEPIMGESVCEMWRDEAYYARDPWRGRWDTEGGGVLTNQAPHNIDFLLWYMGPAEEIFGYWANINHPYVEIEDNAVAVIRFRSGALGLLKGTVSMRPERRLHGVQLLGDSGATVSLECWQVPKDHEKIARGPSDVGSNDVWTVADGGADGPVTRARAIEFGAGELPNFHAYQLRDVLEAVRDKRPPAVTGLDGRRVVGIIQGVYESSRTGRPVKLSD